jgi:hypothetical protein
MPNPGNWEQEGRNVIATLARIEAKVGSIDYALNGNGEPGIKTRLDRLEREAAQTVEGRKWFRRLVVAAFLTALTANSVALTKLVVSRAAAQAQNK